MWGSPGVTEQVLLSETALQWPTGGGSASKVLQRAGLLRTLRFNAKAHYNVSAYTSAPGKSQYSVLGGLLNRLRVEANGQIPLFDCSGYGAMIYAEIINRDGSIAARKAYEAALNIQANTLLAKYEAIGATGDFYAAYPFEIRFALPMLIEGRMQELGIWLLQNQTIELTVSANFNDIRAAAATNNALWSGGTLTGTATAADCKLEIERELYDTPADVRSLPNLTMAHQIVEFVQTFTGGYSRFDIPRAGILNRVIICNLDSSDNPLDNAAVSSLDFSYGTNQKPISRPWWAVDTEFVNDYGQYPPKGVQVLDFYKWGWDGLKLIKNTETLSNLRIESNFTSSIAGKQLIILDRLVPVAARK
jgi:hypothetical protein